MDPNINSDRIFGEKYQQHQRERRITQNTVSGLNAAPTIIFLVSFIFPPLLLPSLIAMLVIAVASPIYNKAIINFIDRSETEELEKQVHFIAKKYGPKILPQIEFHPNFFDNRISYNKFLKNAIKDAWGSSKELQNDFNKFGDIHKLYLQEEVLMQDYKFEKNLYNIKKYQFANLQNLDSKKYPPKHQNQQPNTLSKQRVPFSELVHLDDSMRQRG